MDYWLSTKSATHLLRQPYRTAALADYLRENVGIDPAVLGMAWGLQACQIEAYQRELGLRKIAGHPPRRKI